MVEEVADPDRAGSSDYNGDYSKNQSDYKMYLPLLLQGKKKKVIEEKSAKNNKVKVGAQGSFLFNTDFIKDLTKVEDFNPQEVILDFNEVLAKDQEMKPFVPPNLINREMRKIPVRVNREAEKLAGILE